MILCCGEALIDFLPRQNVGDKRSLFLPIPGGSPCNTAIALGRLGAEVAFFGGISTDFFGEHLISHLEENNVHTSHVLRSALPTSLAFVTPEDKSGEVRYQFYINQTAATSIQLSQIPAELPSSINTLLFGSVSLAIEPAASALMSFMQRHAGDRIITLAPNIRPSLIPDPDMFRERFMLFLQCADIVKLSLTDLRWLYPGQERSEFAELCFKNGVSILFLTSGSHGAWGITRSFECFMEAPRVELCDTVGAGDSFHAGIIAYLNRSRQLSADSLANIHSQDLKDCLAFGSHVAASTCSRPGADPPWNTDL